MDYAHLIHTYLEGTLEEHLEEVLFAELGRNSLLRRELTAQIHITSAARRDAASITPSQFEKNAIFAELGFAAAGAQAEGAMLASATASVRVLPSLASTLVMLFGVLVLTLGLRSDNALLPFFATEAHRNSLPSLALPLFNQEVSSARMNKRVVIKSVQKEHAALLYKEYAQAPSDDFLTVQQIEEQAQERAEETLEPKTEELNNALTQEPQDKHLEAWECHFAPTVEETVRQQEQNSIGSLQQRSAATASLRPTTMPLTPLAKRSTTNSLAEELPVRLFIRQALGGGQVGTHGGVQYALTKQHTIGFEGGNESATLLRKSSQGANEAVSASSEAVFSGTAFYRYTFTSLALSNAIVPFVQAGFGVVGKCGAVQGMGGLRFDVLPELSFTLSAEVKMPVLYEANYFQSKTGFSIGLQYHLSGK